jgi:MarR-like DNA-binding transcriptional regulator SgrR of sgrS sRNA
LRYIPESVNPYSTQVNTDNLIALQIYYPLFQHSLDGTLTSEFLDLQSTKSDDTSFKKFTLCLRYGVQFFDGTPISARDLEHSLQEAHHRQELLSAVNAIRVSGNCVKVVLKAPDPRYFEKLTGTASTITSASRSVNGFPLGLGPYHVESRTSDKLILKANSGRVKGSFRSIEFHKFMDFEQNYANGVFDFNHPGQVSIPEKFDDQFQRVSRPFFKSYAVVVNYPDPILRKRFAACFHKERFRKLLHLLLKETAGFLPSGIQGADGVMALSRKEKGCDVEAVSSMTFLNYRPELESDVRTFLQDSSLKLPIPIKYEAGTIDDLVRRMFHEDKIAAVIGFDSSTSNSSAYAEAATFFESFIRLERSERLISRPLSDVAELVKSAAQATDSAQKASLYQKGHQALLDSGYVIPLGQLDTDQRYPKWIRNIAWSDQISGFPNISLMEAAQ